MTYVNAKLNEAGLQAWNGVSDRLPPGPDYIFRIEKAEVGQSSNNKAQLCIDLVVQNENELKGRKMKAWYNMNFDDPKAVARKRIKSLTDATSCPTDNNGGFDDQMLVGRVFLADVYIDTYEQIDSVTGQKVEKESSKIRNERAITAAPAPGAIATPGKAAVLSQVK